jgi:hypothetical protein
MPIAKSTNSEHTWVNWFVDSSTQSFTERHLTLFKEHHKIRSLLEGSGCLSNHDIGHQLNWNGRRAAGFDWGVHSLKRTDRKILNVRTDFYARTQFCAHLYSNWAPNVANSGGSKTDRGGQISFEKVQLLRSGTPQELPRPDQPINRTNSGQQGQR